MITVLSTYVRKTSITTLEKRFRNNFFESFMCSLQRTLPTCWIDSSLRFPSLKSNLFSVLGIPNYDTNPVILNHSSFSDKQGSGSRFPQLTNHSRNQVTYECCCL